MNTVERRLLITITETIIAGLVRDNNPYLAQRLGQLCDAVIVEISGRTDDVADIPLSISDRRLLLVVAEVTASLVARDDKPALAERLHNLVDDVIDELAVWPPPDELDPTGGDDADLDS